MTENEIIEYLKENKKKGIAFTFLPDEVISFAIEHKEHLKFFNKEGFWSSEKCYHDEDSEISIHEVVCLPEDFELKKESEGEWIEFEINKDSFEIEFGNADYPKLEDFGWWDWQGFLFYCRQEGLPFTAFGGWNYKDNKGWFTSPQVEIENGYLANNYTLEVKPAIPVKIRFWRISK